MNLEYLVLRHILERGVYGDSTCSTGGGARRHKKGAATRIKVAHYGPVLIFLLIARIILNGGEQIEGGCRGRPGSTCIRSGDRRRGRVGSRIVDTTCRAFTEKYIKVRNGYLSIEVSVIEDAGNEVERRAAGHACVDVADHNIVLSAGSFGTWANFLVVAGDVGDVGVGVADSADLLLGNCMLLGVDIRRASRLFAGLGLLTIHLFGGRSASDGYDANAQTFELVDDPFARWAGLLGCTPQLGELLGLIGLALGFGHGESAECNGTAGPLRTCTLQCRVNGVRISLLVGWDEIPRIETY